MRTQGGAWMSCWGGGGGVKGPRDMRRLKNTRFRRDRAMCTCHAPAMRCQSDVSCYGDR